MTKEIYFRNWDFILFKKDNKYIISVVFFGLVDFHRSFYLEPEEITEDYEQLKDLSERIRNNYEQFKS